MWPVVLLIYCLYLVIRSLLNVSYLISAISRGRILSDQISNHMCVSFLVRFQHIHYPQPFAYVDITLSNQIWPYINNYYPFISRHIRSFRVRCYLTRYKILFCYNVAVAGYNWFRIKWSLANTRPWENKQNTLWGNRRRSITPKSGGRRRVSKAKVVATEIEDWERPSNLKTVETRCGTECVVRWEYVSKAGPGQRAASSSDSEDRECAIETESVKQEHVSKAKPELEALGTESKSTHWEHASIARLKLRAGTGSETETESGNREREHALKETESGNWERERASKAKLKLIKNVKSKGRAGTH